MATKFIVFLIFCMQLFSCNCRQISQYLPGFDFELFAKTPVYQLAKAVEGEDIALIESENNRALIDFQEPKFGHTLLMLAVANSKHKSMVALLKQGADPNLLSYSGKTNALIISVDGVYLPNCDSTVTATLLQFNANISMPFKYINKNGTLERQVHSSILNRAISSGKCIEFIKFLVSRGADINNYPGGSPAESPIAYAILTDQLMVAKYLLVDQRAKVPAFVLIRQANIAYQGQPEQRLTVTELLKEKDYPSGSVEAKLRDEIISFVEREKGTPTAK